MMGNNFYENCIGFLLEFSRFQVGYDGEAGHKEL